MGRAKDIIVRVIPSKVANRFIRGNHYSGKVVSNSSLHFGCFLDNSLHGVLSYGSPLDKRKVLNTVKDSSWNSMLELNRMAMDKDLPKNSESRCISISLRLIKKNAPQIKWVLSFSDGTQCGDGVIYRASGFKLIGIKKNKNTCKLKDGSVIHKMTLESSPNQKRSELNGRSYYDLTGGRYNFSKYVKEVGGEVLEGFQLKYIYLIDESAVLNADVLPFSEIDKQGAGMYKGEKITVKERKKFSTE